MSNPYNVRQESRFNPWRVKNIKEWKVLKVYYVKKCIITFQHLIFSQSMSFFFAIYYSISKVTYNGFLQFAATLPENTFPREKPALVPQKQKQVQNRNQWEVFIELCAGICMTCHVIVQQNFLCCLWHCLKATTCFLGLHTFLYKTSSSSKNKKYMEEITTALYCIIYWLAM